MQAVCASVKAVQKCRSYLIPYSKIYIISKCYLCVFQEDAEREGVRQKATEGVLQEVILTNNDSVAEDKEDNVGSKGTKH